MTQPSVATLLTVDEAREIAAQYPCHRYELHEGELVEMTEPKYDHQLLQDRMFEILVRTAGSYGKVRVAFGFRGTPEYDSRSADVALLSRARHLAAIPLKEVFGAPELIIEIISPSNRAGEMDEKEDLCLSHGCLSFWIINPVRRTVKVTDATRHVQWFKDGDSIDLSPFASASISVNEIFAPLT